MKLAILRALPFLNLVLAVTLSVTGDAEPGQAISLSWTGTSPWSLDILTADDSTSDFTLYKNFSPLTVLNAVWNVDVPSGTLVEFAITDATGSSSSQVLAISDSNTDAQASASSASVVSTESMLSTQSELSATSVASISSVSAASLTSVLAAQSTSSPTTDLPQSTSDADTSATSTPLSVTHSMSSRIPAVTHTGASTTSATSTGTALPVGSGHSSGPSAGAIAGGVIGGILAAMVIAVIAWQCYRRRQLRNQRYDLEPHPYVPTDDEGEKGYAFSGGSGNASQGSHRRTLSRNQAFHRDTVNWNPDQPHLTPNVTSNVNGDNMFDRGLTRFSEYIDNQPNALNVDLNPAPPAPPAPAVTRPTVLEIARGATYNPTSINQPSFYAEPPLTSTTSMRYSNVNLDRSSPFADKFAVEGQYTPDLQDPAVAAAYATATGGQAALAPAPRPPRPARPAPNDGIEDVVSRKPSAPRRMSGISNAGPVPTVGHSRKISGPIPIVFPQVPSMPNSPPKDASTTLPSWALHVHGTDAGRYPAPEAPTITLQTPTTAASSSSGMAGIGAGRRAGTGSKDFGRPIYPAAHMVQGPRPMGHKRQQSSQQSAGSQGSMRSPPAVRSPPPTVRSPPPRATPADGIPSMVTSPLTPPRRINADPDVPTTPTTPNLSAFPTPPTRQARPPMTASSSFSSLQHTSSRDSASTPMTSPPTSASTAGPSTTKGSPRALQVPPPPITTTYPTTKPGLSPIAQSPSIPTPLASSALMSPTSPSTMPSRATTMIRRELTQPLAASNSSHFVPSPISPSPMNPTNFHRPAPPPPPPIPADVRESWGKKTVSMSSAASGRRWSDSGEAEEEWKELERQLKWAEAASAHGSLVPQPRKDAAATAS